MIGLFLITESMVEKYDLANRNKTLETINLEVTIPAFLNVIIILFCDEIYSEVAEELTNFENH